MEPRNRAKGTAKEGKSAGFRGKELAEEPFKLQQQIVMKAARQEDAIFREHLGKDLFIHMEDGLCLARLDNVGTDFVKLTSVRYLSENYLCIKSGSGIPEFLKQMKSSGDTNQYGQQLFSGSVPSIIVNKSQILKMMPVSDYE